MSQITVLAPNGRRQVVKTTPNTTILEIIEEVCEKHSCIADEYDLKHHRTVLDATSTIRSSGIPQNGYLELVPCKKKRVESPVILCIQLESGERKQGECLPSDTLWDALTKVVPEKAEGVVNPVIIYLRREVIGKEALSTTTLRTIGLTGGRAAVRLIDRTLEELRTQANISGPLPRPPPPSAAEGPLNLPSTSSTISEPASQISIIPEVIQPLKIAEEPVQCESSNPSPAPTTSSVYDPLMESDDDAASTIVHAEDVSMGDADSIAGAVADTEDVDMILADGVPDKIDDPALSKVVLLGERNAVAYNIDNVPPAEVEDLPDDFYELTIADVRHLAAEAHQRLLDLENAPLLTNELRQLDQDGLVLQKLSQHKSCVIRVRFPDHTVLQGCFKPIETVAQVQDFVREYLEDSTINFYLYTTPPKQILSPDERLVSVDCVPSAILYFGLDSQEPDSVRHYLREDVREKFSNPIAVLLGAKHERSVASTDKPLDSTKRMPKSEPAPSTSGTIRRPASFSQSCQNQRSADSPPQKVPKWFKGTLK